MLYISTAQIQSSTCNEDEALFTLSTPNHNFIITMVFKNDILFLFALNKDVHVDHMSDIS